MTIDITKLNADDDFPSETQFKVEEVYYWQIEDEGERQATMDACNKANEIARTNLENWKANLKVGDLFAVLGGRRGTSEIVKVSRLTPKYFFCMWGASEMKFRKDDLRVVEKSDSHTYFRAYPVTKELLIAVQEETETYKLLYFMDEGRRIVKNFNAEERALATKLMTMYNERVAAEKAATEAAKVTESTP